MVLDTQPNYQIFLKNGKSFRVCMDTSSLFVDDINFIEVDIFDGASDNYVRNAFICIDEISYITSLQRNYCSKHMDSSQEITND